MELSDRLVEGLGRMQALDQEESDRIAEIFRLQGMMQNIAEARIARLEASLQEKDARIQVLENQLQGGVSSS
jgi:hypothetical protein